MKWSARDVAAMPCHGPLQLLVRRMAHGSPLLAVKNTFAIPACHTARSSSRDSLKGKPGCSKVLRHAALHMESRSTAPLNRKRGARPAFTEAA